MSTMPMSAQTWLGAAASFLGIWVVMMAVMMLPSLVPALWRYRQAGLGRLTALVGVGYFAVWTLVGIAAFPLSAALARAVPIAVGAIVLMAGFFQLTAWKARHLARCRAAPVRGRTAWQHGLSLGVHCTKSSAGLMAILLVIGVMDLRAMAVVAAAITVERLAPAGECVARATGAVVVGAGSFLIALAVSPLADRFQSPPNTFRHSASVAAISSFTSAGGTRAYFAPFSLRPCCRRRNSR